MVKEDLEINNDIRNARTLSSNFYTDINYYNESKEKIFASSWQFVADTDVIKIPGQQYPFMLLEGILNEPLLLTRDFDDTVHCLSNVCTHRGTVLVEDTKNDRQIRCRYHGRRFSLDGTFLYMPEMEEAVNFPSESDNLPTVAWNIWKKFFFVSLNPLIPFNKMVNEMEKRIGWMPIDEFRFDPTRSKDYLVQTNWALYCENYLEGFHIPYVHQSLSNTLDYGNYRTELFEYANLQVGIVKSGELHFDLPKDSKDYGQDIAAYYFWLFPNVMFNFYPWGLSINVVKPVTINRTRVSFLTYIWKEELLDSGVGSGLDRVEREDEAVVEAVQIGIHSRYYNRGRYSPKRETGIHHFHKLLTNFMQ